VEIRKVVEEAFTIGHNVIIFDLSGCEKMDSSGVGMCLNLWKKLSSQNGLIGFLNISEDVQDVLKISNAHQIPVYTSEDQIQIP